MIQASKIVVIVGPTASGKSDIANILGNNIHGEIISADSMQIYKGMDIGTGKIKHNVQLVKHWGLDIVEPNQPFSAALFQKYSRNVFADIFRRQKIPILCGGTGFYIRAAIDDYDFPKGKQINNSVREKYIKFANQYGNDALWNKLNSIDPESAKIIHKNNVVRVVRALELHNTGKSYAEQVKNLQNIKQKYLAQFYGLLVSPEVLNQRINNRVEQMVTDGLINEVKNLLNKGYRNAITASNAIGYKEIVSALDGNCSMDEAIDQIKTSTRHYAKRQRTWFRKDSRIKWINYNDLNTEYAVQTIENDLDINEQISKKKQDY